jgi:hypothetical protein
LFLVGVVDPTIEPAGPETGFAEMNGGCLRADIRERKENSPEALSNFRAVVFSGSELRLRVASPIAEKQAEVVLPVVNHQSSVAH